MRVFLEISKNSKATLIMDDSQPTPINEPRVPMPPLLKTDKLLSFNDWYLEYYNYVSQMLEYILQHLTMNDGYSISIKADGVHESLARYVYSVSENSFKNYRFFK